MKTVIYLKVIALYRFNFLALQWLRKDEGLIQAEVIEMKADAAQMAVSAKLKFKDYFKQKYLRTPFIIGLVLMLGQQFSGINAVSKIDP